jgi:hypothetical protein
MSNWIDHRALWQLTVLHFSAMLVAVVVGGIGLENLIGRVDAAPVAGFGTVFSAGQTSAGIWSRQRRLHRLSSQERVSVPGQMRPHVGLSAVARAVEHGRAARVVDSEEHPGGDRLPNL